MAHDIIAKCKRSGERISFISIGAFHQGKSWILYESLNCSDFNSGVSGNGGCIVLSENELKISLSKFNYLKGEPVDDIRYTVESSPPCKNTRGIFNRVLKAIGSKSRQEDIRINLDTEALSDVQRFLESVQGNGDVVIQFA